MRETAVSEPPETTPRDRATQGAPGWVKGFLVVAAILTLLVIIMLLIGEHGPGKHSQGGPSTPRAGQGTSTTLVPA